MTDNKFMQNLTCALCNMGFINPEELYKKSEKESANPTLLTKDCYACYPQYAPAVKTDDIKTSIDNKNYTINKPSEK